MKNLLSLRGNRKPQSALLGVAFLAVFTLLAAFILITGYFVTSLRAFLSEAIL
ncbi:hypothetical protein L0337_43125 [candidate division KSB1 bacterium]|nr:hypothetical protein [candidate division KSB1 bacterium]